MIIGSVDKTAETQEVKQLTIGKKYTMINQRSERKFAVLHSKRK